MDRYLHRVGNHAINGLKEFSAHPLHSIKESIRNYAGLGLMVAGGYLMSDSAEKFNFFGDRDFLAGLGLAALGYIASIASPSFSRMENFAIPPRDILAGIGAYLVGQNQHPHLELGALTLAASLYFEMMRRRIAGSIHGHRQSQPETQSLEHIVD